MATFADIRIGERAEITHTISDKDIEKFVELTGDDNAIHTDASFAGRTSFKKPVAHGMLSASFISTIIGTKLPGDGALWYAQNLEFLLPVRIGDTISVVAEVIAKHDSLQAIELQTDIFNQDHQKVITGKAKVKIVEEHHTEKRKLIDVMPQGQTALIAGASGGIGRATALQLAKMGYRVVLHYHHQEASVQELLKDIQAIPQRQAGHAIIVQADLTKESEIAEMLQKAQRKLGPVSIFVNCASLKLPTAKFAEISWEDIDKQLEINVRVNFIIAKALVPQMKELHWGKFIFLTSQVTEGTPPTDRIPYVVGKSALHGLGKALAVELAPHNITVNMVSPGMTDTNLIASIPEKARMLVAAKTPLKRLATPEDVAKVISFLVQDGSYLTGETIRVNGGTMMI